MKLMALLPNTVYSGEKHVQEFQDAVEMALTRAQTARDDLYLQVRPSTVTWGISLFEQDYGIEPEAGKPLEQRRQNWRAKRRGKGTTTKELLRKVASSFTNGDVDIIEFPSEYRFVVKFTGQLGIPPNIEDLQKIIEEIKPAHLGFELAFLYHIHAELSHYTNAELAEFTHLHLREGGLPIWTTNRQVGEKRHNGLAVYSHREIRRGQMGKLISCAAVGTETHLKLSAERHFAIRHGLKN